MHVRNHGNITLRSSLAHVDDITWFGAGVCALFSWEAIVGSNGCMWVIVVVAEQRISIKFCVKIGKFVTETFDLLKVVYGESALGWRAVFDWHRWFRVGERKSRTLEPEDHQPMHMFTQGIYSPGSDSESTVLRQCFTVTDATGPTLSPWPAPVVLSAW